MVIKEGYKQTEIGLIPVDWEIFELNNLIDSNRSIRYGIVQPGKFDPYGRFMVRGQDYSFGWVDSNQMFRVSPEIEERYKNARLTGGDIILTIVGAGTGKLEVVPNWLNGSNITQTTARIAIDSNKADSNYCKFYFQTNAGKTQINLYIKGAAQPGLNIRDIRTFLIPLPPSKAEQTAIATALSDADGLITGLEKLIAKKRNIKQGAMQQLLQPKEGWEVKKLGEVCDIKKGQLITEETRTLGLIPVIAGGKKPAYYHNKPNRLGRTITISGSGANAGYVSFHNYPIFASDCSTIEDSKLFSIDFIFYFLQSSQEKIYKMQTGGAQPHIHPSDLNPLIIYIPKIEEQTRIANILSDMDAELLALEQKLEKYKKVKLGMMQELLTGKTRLN